jgi:quercetin dioxygenase-like cupin family protein
MRPANTIVPPPTGPIWSDAAGPPWSDAALVDLTIRLATRPGSDPPRHDAGPPLWSVPLLVTPEVEAWLVGWPAGLVTGVHDHGGGTEAVTVVEGSLSEECLDPTIWTTGRRTTWRAGASTLVPAGHVHLLGAAGGRPAVAVHAWSVVTRSADGAAGRSAAPVRRAPTGGRGPGRGRGAEAVGVGLGRGRGRACWADQPLHGAPDLGHVGDRVPV